MGERFLESPYLKGITTLIPVQLHPQREHIRGYNQSALITSGINKVLSLEYQDNNLIRVIHTASQTRKSRQERWENVSDTFKIMDKYKLAGKHVLLVDDVLTTGATLEACATLLLECGVEKVSIATMACVD
jgi:ComF family protein